MNKSNLVLCVIITIFLFIYGHAFCQDSLYVDTEGDVGIGTTDPKQNLHVSGNIRTDGRWIYFGADQRIIGDDNTALYYDSNNDTMTQMIFRDKQGTIYGRVYGSTDGAYFGLLDGDGNWSYFSAKDSYTQFLINNSAKMTIKSSGNIGIGTTNPSDKLDIRPISYSSNQDGGIRLCDTGGHWPHRIALKSNGGGAPRLSFDSYLYSDVLTINSSVGRVGIGIAYAGYKLDVNGPVRAVDYFYNTSDVRLKKNIEPIQSSIDKLTQLEGVYYEWADEEADSGKRIGLVAQEVEEVFPEAVSTDEEGIKSIAYGSLVAPLIEAVKELKSENDDLKAENDEFRSRLEKLEEIVAQLQK